MKKGNRIADEEWNRTYLHLRQTYVSIVTNLSDKKESFWKKNLLKHEAKFRIMIDEKKSQSL